MGAVFQPVANGVGTIDGGLKAALSEINAAKRRPPRSAA
jgi:hypothetical protein